MGHYASFVIRTVLNAVKTAVLMPLFAIFTLMMATAVIVVSLIRRDAPFVEKIILFWCRVFLLLGPITYEVSGLENIDQTRRAVVVSNHDSNFDIPIAFLTLRLPIRYLAKKELFSIPLFAEAMRRVGMIETDRAVGVKAIGQVNTGVSGAVARGHQLMIYPEGTRTAGVATRPFKKGAFRIAIDNDLDIIPMAIVGSGEAWEPGSKIIYPGHVKARVLEMVSTQGMTVDDVTALKDKVEAMIHGAIDEMRDQAESQS